MPRFFACLSVLPVLVLSIACGGRAVDGGPTDGDRPPGAGNVQNAPSVPATVLDGVESPRDIAVTNGKLLVNSGRDVPSATYANIDGTNRRVVTLGGERRAWLGANGSLVTYGDGRIEALAVTDDDASAPRLYTLSVPWPDVIYGPPDIAMFAADATYLYWASFTKGVFRAAWHAAAPSRDDVAELVTSTSPTGATVGARAVTVDDDNVYWASHDELLVTPKARGASTSSLTSLLLAEDDKQVDRQLIAVTNDASAVYLLERGAIRRVGKADGRITAPLRFVNAESPAAFVVAGADLYITVDSSTSTSSGKVLRLPASGGAPVAVASDLRNPYGITADADSVYWTARTYGSTAGTITSLRVR